MFHSFEQENLCIIQIILQAGKQQMLAQVSKKSRNYQFKYLYQYELMQ